MQPMRMAMPPTNGVPAGMPPLQGAMPPMGAMAPGPGCGMHMGMQPMAMGMRPGFALDMRVVRPDGEPWDFTMAKHREDVMAAADDERTAPRTPSGGGSDGERAIARKCAAHSSQPKKCST